MWFVPIWVIPRRLSFNCRRFGTQCRFHLHRQVNEVFIHLPMKIEPIMSSETSAIRTQTPGNYPNRNKLHLEHGESLKNKYCICFCYCFKLHDTGPRGTETCSRQLIDVCEISLYKIKFCSFSFLLLTTQYLATVSLDQYIKFCTLVAVPGYSILCLSSGSTRRHF